jgi:hypothetical protein
MGLLDQVFGTQNKVQEVFSPAEAFAAIPPVSSAIPPVSSAIPPVSSANALAEESIRWLSFRR